MGLVAPIGVALFAEPISVHLHAIQATLGIDQHHAKLGIEISDCHPQFLGGRVQGRRAAGTAPSSTQDSSFAPQTPRLAAAASGSIIP